MTLLRTPPKWTASKVIGTLGAMVKYLNDNPTTFTVTQVSTAFKLYPKWFKRMAEKYANNEKIQDSIQHIYAVCEGRIAEAGLKGLINPTFGIFVLKANYGYVETQYVQQTNTNEHSGDVTVTIKKITKEEK